MTPQELAILQHALGLDPHGQGRSWRNHFCTGSGSTDHAVCDALVDQGLMIVRRRVDLYAGDDLFRVTSSGRDAVARFSPAPPPAASLSRSQQRYRRFLDLDSGLSFGEFLRTRYSDMRSYR